MAGWRIESLFGGSSPTTSRCFALAAKNAGSAQKLLAQLS